LINASPDPAVRERRLNQYLWLKQHWYRGAEFKSGPSNDPTRVSTQGLLCLPGECAVPTPPPPPPPPPITREQCLADCRAEQLSCSHDGVPPRTCSRLYQMCVSDCPP
jgi:hypothetical protein